jgi:hypothetical protein
VNIKDVTAIFDHYRMTARGLWNTAFWPDPDFRNWDSIEQFDEVEKLLFRGLVLSKIDKDWPLEHIFTTPLPYLHVVPSHERGGPIMIQNPRPGAPRGYWDDPINWVKPEEAELLFISYFDWNQMDYIDLQYYLVKITRFDNHDELIGREALIERQNAAVKFVSE